MRSDPDNCCTSHDDQFMEMKTTAVRKLLPDQWGFLCPVHTPDGGKNLIAIMCCNF